MDSFLTISAKESLNNLRAIMRGDLIKGLHAFLSREPIAEAEDDKIILPILQKAYMNMSIHYADCRNDLIMRDALVAQHDLNMLGYAI